MLPRERTTIQFRAGFLSIEWRQVELDFGKKFSPLHVQRGRNATPSTEAIATRFTLNIATYIT